MKKTLYPPAVFAVCLLLACPATTVFAASEREKELGKSKEQVARENTEYIEKEYARLKHECQSSYEGEQQRECLHGTEQWRKEQLRKVEQLKEYLSK
jgi:hypothetical protein